MIQLFRPRASALKRYAVISLIISLGAFSNLSSNSIARASAANNGTINTIISMPSGVFLFNSNGTRTTIPSCATNEPARWAINGSTAAGQSTIAVVLSAYAAGKQVFVSGASTCNTWGDTEDVQYVGIVD
jgi:hypothetical protein